MIINTILSIIRLLNRLLYNIRSLLSILTTCIILYFLYKIYQTWIFDKILNFLNNL